MRVSIHFKQDIHLPVDLRGVSPEWALAAPLPEVLDIGIRVGNRAVPLGEISQVDVDAEAEDELRLSGATHLLQYAGAGMTGGRLVIAGDAGHWAGQEMSGGELVILGSAGDELGAGMLGGTIRVAGNCGDDCGASLPGRGAGMTGGEILVSGSAGDETGAGMRRGLIVVGADCGRFTGAEMLAGSVVVLGTADSGTGFNMRRGSLVVRGLKENPSCGFFSAGNNDPVWLRILLRRLRRLNFSIPDAWDTDAWTRFTGDHTQLGKGEIIVHDPIK